MNTFLKLISLVIVAASISFSVANAEEMQIQAQQAKPQLKIQASGAAKPPTCAVGFTPVGMKLVEHEGKKWYEYSCVREEIINRTCNTDTQVYDVNDKFISLPSDGVSKKSKLQMQYKCFNYVPVE